MCCDQALYQTGTPTTASHTTSFLPFLDMNRRPSPGPAPDRCVLHPLFHDSRRQNWYCCDSEFHLIAPFCGRDADICAW